MLGSPARSGAPFSSHLRDDASQRSMINTRRSASHADAQRLIKGGRHFGHTSHYAGGDASSRRHHHDEPGLRAEPADPSGRDRKPAGAGLLPLQGRRHRSDGHQRRLRAAAARGLRPQRRTCRRQEGAAGRVPAADALPIPFTTLVLNSGGRIVLIDTGNGDSGAADLRHWMTNFRAAGFDPARVNTIIISHFHGDHINGLRRKDGTAVFPNAEVMVPAPEWAFWMDDAKMARRRTP